MEKIKISIVSYLNTTSFLYGIEQDQSLLECIELNKDIPSECARKLQEGEVDLGLVPVAVIPKLKESHLISDYCIGAVGKVKSVLLVSDVPLQKIEKIYLDFHSRTSVALCQLLSREYWNIHPEFLAAGQQYISKIKDTTAGVIIGDRTFHMKREYAYRYDLSEEWQKMTGLPFVFAAWVSNKKLDPHFIEKFNAALSFGLAHTDTAIQQLTEKSIDDIELKEYLTNYIQFELDEQKLKGLNLFLEKIS